jgi:succinoglycan biosynthesis protein ExoM
MKISICVNTYRRPHIYNTLLSIASQSLPPDTDIEIIISDNDALGSGKEYVDNFVAETGLEANYEIVPEKNIAVARNNAVHRATGSWILFIDDDEIAEPGWIISALDCASEFNADLVLGPVHARYAEGIPNWIAKADPMSKSWGARGTILPMASTCNLLVKRELLRQTDGPFDKTYGKMGCDDAELTHRLFKQGAIIVVNDGGAVSELVPVERGTLQYLGLRYRRLGQSHYLVISKYVDSKDLVVLTASAAIRLFVFGILAAILSVIDRSLWLRMKLRYWRNLGKLENVFKRKNIELY